MANVKEAIKLAALGLGIGIGDSSRDQSCPQCGRVGDFGITRTDQGLLYHCYRATCGFAGFISSNGNEYTSKVTPQKIFEPRLFTRPLKPLTALLKPWLLQKYNIEADIAQKQGIRWSYTENRLYMPIFTYEGYQAGCVTKKLPPEFITPTTDVDLYNKDKKSLCYWQNDVIKLHFPINPGRSSCRSIVVVEDQLSSIRALESHHDACALLGTTFSDAQAGYLAQRYDTLILALDADTWQPDKDNVRKDSLGYKYERRYGLLFKKFIVKRITKDVKDMQPDELRKELEV